MGLAFGVESIAFRKNGVVCRPSDKNISFIWYSSLINHVFPHVASRVRCDSMIRRTVESHTICHSNPMTSVSALRSGDTIHPSCALRL